MAAGAGQLSVCPQPGFYEDQERRTRRLVDRFSTTPSERTAARIFTRGSIFWLAFSDRIHIRRSSEIDADSMAHFRRLHAALLSVGSISVRPATRSDSFPRPTPMRSSTRRPRPSRTPSTRSSADSAEQKEGRVGDEQRVQQAVVA